ncbi:MAG: hypothetical protein LBG65_07505 [Puniceicoccales bacterium]|jgi:peptidoglycan/xylan/chitin deacetylase (PgdA/CDA1 family)|nr:hypothetical protein [Puniceicoccales bacterium]
MANSSGVVENWLPEGKKGAICFSIDDLHPQKSPTRKSDGFYEGGGDLGKGAMGHVLRLLDRHPGLRVTLFTTADWRETFSHPTRRILAAIPRLRDHLWLAPRHPKGTMRLDRHPEFVDFLKNDPRFEIALHGLHHCHKGLRVPVEFQDQSREEFDRILGEIVRVFRLAGLPFEPGLCPPGWNAPENLLGAMPGRGLRFVASARDVLTPVSRNAKTNMSGMKNVSLIHPERICGGKLLHFTANFQATSEWGRAFDILENNGLLHIKAHITGGMLDSVCALYMNYLDQLLSEIEKRHGDSILHTSMGSLAKQILPA